MHGICRAVCAQHTSAADLMDTVTNKFSVAHALQAHLPNVAKSKSASQPHTEPTANHIPSYKQTPLPSTSRRNCEPQIEATADHKQMPLPATNDAAASVRYVQLP